MATFPADVAPHNYPYAKILFRLRNMQNQAVNPPASDIEQQAREVLDKAKASAQALDPNSRIYQVSVCTYLTNVGRELDGEAFFKLVAIAKQEGYYVSIHDQEYAEFVGDVVATWREHIEAQQAAKPARPASQPAPAGCIQTPWNNRPGAWANPAHLVELAKEKSLTFSMEPDDLYFNEVCFCDWLLIWADQLAFSDDRQALMQAAEKAGFDLTPVGVGRAHYRRERDGPF